jgi:predicted nucleic acid-binding protein
VALADELQDGAVVALDTNVVIYYVEAHPRYLPIVDSVFDLIRTGRVMAHVSTISLLEVLVRPYRERRDDLVNLYRGILIGNEWLTIHQLTLEIAEEAATIRAQYRVEVADAIVAATAHATGCDYLITNNVDDFSRIHGLSLLQIDDYL